MTATSKGLPGKGGWNYRVFERQVPTGEGDTEAECFIGEAYYDDEGKVVAWTGPVEVIGEDTRASVRDELESMLKALDRPTLDYDAEPPVALLDEDQIPQPPEPDPQPFDRARLSRVRGMQTRESGDLASWWRRRAHGNLERANAQLRELDEKIARLAEHIAAQPARIRAAVAQAERHARGKPDG